MEHAPARPVPTIGHVPPQLNLDCAEVIATCLRLDDCKLALAAASLVDQVWHEAFGRELSRMQSVRERILCEHIRRFTGASLEESKSISCLNHRINFRQRDLWLLLPMLGNTPAVQLLTLRGTSLCENGIKLLSDHAWRFSYLHRLTLANMDLDDAAAALLADGVVSALPQLDLLDLRFNLIGTRGILALLPSLSRSVLDLDLGHNRPLTRRAALAILTSEWAQMSLQKFKLPPIVGRLSMQAIVPLLICPGLKALRLESLHSMINSQSRVGQMAAKSHGLCAYGGCWKTITTCMPMWEWTLSSEPRDASRLGRPIAPTDAHPAVRAHGVQDHSYYDPFGDITCSIS